VENQHLHPPRNGIFAAVRLLPMMTACALLLAACGEKKEPVAAEPTSEAGPCDLARPKKTIDPPAALIVPDGIEVESISPQPPNEKVEGFLPMKPGDFVAHFEREKRLGILFSENEGRDAEMMVTDGKRRSFWKLTLACPEGSRFTVLTGEEQAPAAARRAIKRHQRSG
jgi:hypothetical protein